MTKARKRKKPKQRIQQPESTLSPVMIGVVIIGALAVVGGLILLGNLGRDLGEQPVDVSQFPALGDANAPVTMMEFSDYG